MTWWWVNELLLGDFVLFWITDADVSDVSLCLLQYHGSLRIRGAGDWEIRPRVLQRHLALHHVRRASVRRPHPQTLHRHLPRAGNWRAGAGGGPVRQTHLPLPLARDHDQMDEGEDQMSLLGLSETQRSQRRRIPLLAGRRRYDCETETNSSWEVRLWPTGETAVPKSPDSEAAAITGIFNEL